MSNYIFGLKDHHEKRTTNKLFESLQIPGLIPGHDVSNTRHNSETL